MLALSYGVRSDDKRAAPGPGMPPSPCTRPVIPEELASAGLSPCLLPHAREPSTAPEMPSSQFPHPRSLADTCH